VRILYDNQSVKQDDIFVTTILKSAYNNAFLSLANLVERDKDSINLHYLINCVKDTKELFNEETFGQFLNFSNEFEGSFSAISKTIEHVLYCEINP